MLIYNDKNHWNLNLRDEFFQKVILLLCRLLIHGIRAIMDIIVLNKKKSIEDGVNKLNRVSNRKNYQAYELFDPNYKLNLYIKYVHIINIL